MFEPCQETGEVATLRPRCSSQRDMGLLPVPVWPGTARAATLGHAGSLDFLHSIVTAQKVNRLAAHRLLASAASSRP